MEVHNNGEYIAIWNVIEEMDDMILTSKIIHEMFHAFQMQNGESRFPNEFEALKRYQYTAENLAIKWEENKLISKLVQEFQEEEFEKLLALRKYRSLHFEYEYRYEAAIEQIEGTANYVELNALKQLSEEKYKNSLHELQQEIQRCDCMIPIRVISYPVGALCFQILKENKITYFEKFTKEPTMVSILADTEPYQGAMPKDEAFQTVVASYYEETEKIIQKALTEGQLIDQGEFELRGLNVYNARYTGRYFVSTYFVAYGKDGKEQLAYGDFVIQTNENGNITRIIQFQ